MEPTVEQRKHRHHPFNFQGVYSSGSVQVREAVVLDLSMGGCRVASTIPMPPDTAIQLQIRPHQAAPFMSTARSCVGQGATHSVCSSKNCLNTNRKR